jgi:hypothetical protein
MNWSNETPIPAAPPFAEPALPENTASGPQPRADDSFEAIDLRGCGRRWCDEFAAICQGRNPVRVRFQDVPARVILNPALVRAITMTLLAGAARSSAPGQPVRLGIYGTPPEFVSFAFPRIPPNGCGIVIEVQDWGTGRPGGQAAESATALIPGGTALAPGSYAAVEKLVAAHRGRIARQQVAGAGTVVNVLLPACFPLL